MAHAGLGRGQRRVGHEVHVRLEDPVAVGVEDDRAVHLRELEEPLRRERRVDDEAAVAQSLDAARVADDDRARRCGPR